jgi:hypothetical protein
MIIIRGYLLKHSKPAPDTYPAVASCCSRVAAVKLISTPAEKPAERTIPWTKLQRQTRCACTAANTVNASIHVMAQLQGGVLLLASM